MRYHKNTVKSLFNTLIYRASEQTDGIRNSFAFSLVTAPVKPDENQQTDKEPYYNYFLYF
jgi:hypothetical protein